MVSVKNYVLCWSDVEVGMECDRADLQQRLDVVEAEAVVVKSLYLAVA